MIELAIIIMQFHLKSKAVQLSYNLLLDVSNPHSVIIILNFPPPPPPPPIPLSHAAHQSCIYQQQPSSTIGHEFKETIFLFFKFKLNWWK